MAETIKILFVDDEPAIRASLPAILRMHGFDVTSAANVGEAVQAIAAQRFDVLISDLNIGSPGDGFTVVSAMRRTQPDCVTLILTGYPAFETALQAIRSQVDDYLIKPAGVQELVESIEKKLRDRKPHQLEKVKRVPQLISEHVSEIVTRILEAEKKFLHGRRVQIDEEDFRSNAEIWIGQLVGQLSSGSRQLSPELLEWSRQYGRLRYIQGYSADMLVEENRIVCSAIHDSVHENLLVVDLSQLIPDLKLLSLTLSLMLREAITAHTTNLRAA